MVATDHVSFVKAAESSLLNAQLQGNKGALEELISEEYVGINPDGSRVGKLEEIRNLLSTSYSSGDIVELEVKPFGETIIATGHVVLRSEDISHRFAFTDVYIGKKLVSSQAVLLG